MDDLSALDWSSTSHSNKTSTPPLNPSNARSYPALRPTPSPLSSGHNTPLYSQGSGNSNSPFKPPPPSNPSKTAQDSFSNLVNFGHAKSTANLSLRERQERLEAEKRKKQEDLRKQAQANYGDGRFFDTLASTSGFNSRTASPALPSQVAQERGKTDSDDDLFAAFNAETKVDNASHYPPPADATSRKATPASAPALNLSDPSAWDNISQSSRPRGGIVDDDPFDLDSLNLKSREAAAPTATQGDGDDDDFLGDLGKPVDEVRRKAHASKSADPEPGKPIEDVDSDSSADQAASGRGDPFDRAVAELVDYGFSPENARRGLTESGTGLNVQAAANWLLDDAHREAKEKARRQQPSHRAANGSDGRQQAQSKTANGPAWMSKDGRDGRRDVGTPTHSDGDLAKTAAAMGTSFLKSANSLWKTGQKKMQQAVADFQHEGDPSQPRWMRSAQGEHMSGGHGTQRQDVTDEAMMLEGAGRPDRKTHPKPQAQASLRAQTSGGADKLPARSSPVPRWQQTNQSSMRDPRARLNQQTAEEQSAQAYISPARRKKPAQQQPQEPQAPLPQVKQDLPLRSSTPSTPSSAQSRQVPKQQQPTSRPTPPPPRPAPPRRQIPACSPAAMQTSTRHRVDGTEHFKRGDFAAAHTSYSSSLAALPSGHPLAIVLLCNRALTALRTGEPRRAIEDADAALAVIGPGKGENEHVSLEDGTGEKRDMKDLYGKALTRKAEGLEQMEKWSDAMAVWQSGVEAGVGGPTAIAGRQRCQKALAPKPTPKLSTSSPRSTTPAARPKPRPAAAPAKNSDAVERLRAANKAAEAADGERFALVDQVDARIAAWRDGKRDNLRALLGSLDQVLWESSGWKKVGLHELVLANKVKIVYMKAIAKCHPDKLAQDTSTEARMIAATVFSTLNEAWDKFKADNGL